MRAALDEAAARRRRRAVRGLPALPLPRLGAEEPAALAVRRAHPARVPRRAGPLPHRGACSSAGPAPSCTCGCGSCTCAPGPSTITGGRPVDELGDGDDRHFPWEEGVPREVDAAFPVDGPGDLAATTVPFELPAEHDVERVAGGRVERRCLPLTGRLVVVGRAAARALRRAAAAHRRRQRLRLPRRRPARGGPADVADRRAHPAGRHRGRVPLGHRPARVGAARHPRAGQPAHLAGARRAARAHRPAALVADHPRRPPAARSGEPDEPVRRHRDRRDPQPAHAGAHRRGEGGGAGDGPARRRGRRRRGRDAARRSGSACTARSAPLRPAGCDPR